MRQQKLRCPFLVISGGNECYHNPHSLTLSSPLLLSVPCQPPVKLLCSVVQRLFTKLLSIFIVRLSICPPLAPLPLCQCQYTFLFFLLLLLCFDWPFQCLLLCISPSSLWPALWSFCGLALCAGDWTVRDDVQGKPQLIKNTLDREAVVLH